MKVHRFIGEWPLATGTLRLDDAALAHQVRDVLKLRPGEALVLSDGRGLEAHCRLVKYDRGALYIECLSLGRSAAETPLTAILYCAVLKADRFELAAQKATEVGVACIAPVLTARTVKTGLRTERLVRIVREAAEQSGRGRVPEVTEPLPFASALDDAARHDTNYFFEPSGEVFSAPATSVRTAGVWIGPEGGWEQDETEQARRVGMHVVSLGSLILRAETAAAVAGYLVARGPLR